MPNCFAILLAVLFCVSAAHGRSPQAPSGWKLNWHDDFNNLDERKWKVVETTVPTNDSLQAYLPQQVSVADGKLVIVAKDKPYKGLAFRSGQVISRSEQRHGRWEVRAKLPTSKGMWPAIWLLPDVEKYPWPSGGEIDIMENRGDQPLVTSSAFHYGTKSPFKHDFVFHEQRTTNAGGQENYHDEFHVYAVDWLPKQLRFYVDGVHHYTVHNEQVGGFLTKSVQPMQLVINNAIGGTFLPNPDETTQWPQQMEVDWVRVYTQDGEIDDARFVNGSFEQAGGSLYAWTIFGNRTTDTANVQITNEITREGSAALELSGQFSGDINYSGVTQGIRVDGGQDVTASLQAFVPLKDSLVETDNSVTMKIEFYDAFGALYGSESMLFTEEKTIADADTLEDQWHTYSLVTTAPYKAVEARLAIVFTQMADKGGTVYVDGVKFRATD